MLGINTHQKQNNHRAQQHADTNTTQLSEKKEDGGGVEIKILTDRLGRESCDQISASPNRPKRAKSRDKTAGSLFTRAYTLVKFSQTKRCFFSFYNKTYKDKCYINIIIVYTTQFIFC